MRLMHLPLDDVSIGSSSGRSAAIIVDDFYEDPYAIREKALAMRFVQYSPPTSDGAMIDLDTHTAQTATWWASANLIFRGKPVARPFEGARYNPISLANKLADLVGETVDGESWNSGGDGWNGAFHLITEGWRGSSIHHHHRAGDIEGLGWSGVVYLSPNAPSGTGTTIWRDKRTGRYTAPYGATYHMDMPNYDLVSRIENRFNRLLLLRADILHRGEHGFGCGLSARLTQTFFFKTIGVEGGNK